MTIIIVLLSVILFVLVYTFLLLKNATEFMANKLIDIDNNLEKAIRLLVKLNKK